MGLILRFNGYGNGRQTSSASPASNDVAVFADHVMSDMD
jgi:hypothetical protein